MKRFFKNKTNVILSIILIVLIGLGVFFAVNVLKEPEVLAAEFTSMNKQEVESWAIENNCVDKIEFKEEYDDFIDEGNVIYQSVQEGESINDGIMIIISKGKDLSKEITIEYDANTTKEQLDLWFLEYGFTNITYEYIKDETFDEGIVISVSPKEAKLDDPITVKVASSYLVEVPDFTYYVKSEIDTWAKDNSITVKYEYSESENDENTVLKQSIEAGEYIKENTTITVTLSKGNAKTGFIPANYLGMAEDEFLTKLKTIGFTNFKKNETTYFSAKSKKSTIFSYDDGTFKLDTEINYAISEGQYTFSESEYNDKALDTVNALIKKYNDRNAHITLKYTETKTSEHTENNLYDCTSSFTSPNTTITCKLAKKTSETTTEKTGKICTDNCYLGKTEEEFVEGVKALGFEVNKQTPEYYSANKAKGLIYSYDHDDGNTYDIGTVVNYRMTAGKYFEEFNASDYNGKTLSEANAIKDTYNARNARITEIAYNEVETSDKTAGTLYDCSAQKSGDYNTKITCKLAKAVTKQETTTTKYYVKSLTDNPCTSTSCKIDGVNYSISKEYSNTIAEGKVISQSIAGGTEVNENITVNVVVSKGVETKTILDMVDYQNLSLSYSSVEQTKNKMNELLGSFNLSYVEQSDKDYNVGTIISISVNGNTNYSKGSYPVTSKVIITICNKQG